MKHLLLYAACAVLMSTGLFAQGYYSFTQTGTSAPYSASTLGSVIVAQGKNDVYSVKRDIPFTWKFYGKDVKQYLASDNGYITFNTDDIFSDPDNIAIPSTSAPKNAIFAFWENLKLEGSGNIKAEVRASTYGAEPNRVHVIQWWTSSKEDAAVGADNYLYFAIRLYEGGDFDIVYNDASPNNTSFSGTIGCQNADGTIGTSLSGSPSADFPNKKGSQSAAGDKVFTFVYGTQLDVEGKIVANTTPTIITTDGARIGVSVRNMGKKDKISSGKFNYSVDGGATVTGNFKSSVAINGGTGNVISPADYVPTDADLGKTKTIRVWLSEINGMADGTPGSKTDVFTLSVFINKGLSVDAADRRVMLEEGSGGWCGFCPDGHLKMRDILEQYPDQVVSVVHHNSDGMAQARSNTINTAFATGYPYGMVDRVPVGGSVGLSRTDWENAVSERLNAVTPAKIKITNAAFNEATRQITFNVETEFIDYALPGDIRVSAMIVEDNVRGPKISATNTQWNQHNYYSKNDAKVGGASHELYEEPAYFFGYLHRHVVRDVLVDAWGIKTVAGGEMPNNPAPGGKYVSSFSYTLPEEVQVEYTESPVLDTKFQSTKNGAGMNKAKDIKLVALLSYYKPNAEFTNANQREIINATELSLKGGGSTSVTPEVTGVAGSSVYPNPASGLTRAEFTLNAPSRVSAEIMNLVGQKVQTIKEGLFNEGTQSVWFSTESLTNGTYFISIKTEEGTFVRTFMVANKD